MFLHMEKFAPLCIRADKLFDWVTRRIEKTFDFDQDDINFFDGRKSEINPCEFFDDPDDVEVDIKNVDIECDQVGSRQDVYLPELELELQEVRIKKQGTFQVVLAGEHKGKERTLTSSPVNVCFFERFILCAPESTEISCEVYDAGGSGALLCVDNDNGDFELSLSLLICQSVQVSADVIMEVEGKICRPRNDIVLPVDHVCDEIPFPKQCPQIFPAESK